MKLVDEYLAEIFAPNEAQVHDNFNKRIQELDIDGVSVTDVSIEYGGDAIVTFADEDGSEMDVLFTNDEEEGAVAINLDDQQDYFDNDDDDIDLVDLSTLDPKLIDYGEGNIGFDLLELGWLTDDALLAIVSIGDFLDVPQENGDVSEAMTTVIRNGKKVRVPLVRRRRRKRMSSKQKAAIRKGVRTRKKKRSQTSRKLKKSLRIRRKSNIKRSSSRSHKVAGTSDRK